MGELQITNGGVPCWAGIPRGCSFLATHIFRGFSDTSHAIWWVAETFRLLENLILSVRLVPTCSGVILFCHSYCQKRENFIFDIHVVLRSPGKQVARSSTLIFLAAIRNNTFLSYHISLLVRTTCKSSFLEENKKPCKLMFESHDIGRAGKWMSQQQCLKPVLALGLKSRVIWQS